MTSGSEGDDLFWKLDPFFDNLRRCLSRASRFQQMAFAAYCCERLLPNYERFAQKVGPYQRKLLREMIDRVWFASEGHEIVSSDWQSLLGQCESIDVGDEVENTLQGEAVSALAAAALAIRVGLGKAPAEHAARAASQLFDVTYQRVSEELEAASSDDCVGGKTLEQAIQSDSRLEGLRSELIDLLDYVIANDIDRDFTSRLRRRAAAEAMKPMG